MLGRIINHNTPYLLQNKDGVFTDPETGKKLGFDTRFMGKGEGAQVHGWGIYLSVANIRHYGNFHKRSVRIKEEIFDCNFIVYGQVKTIPLKISRDEMRAYKLALTAGNIASHFDLIDCSPDDVKKYIQHCIAESKAKIEEKESLTITPRLRSEIANEKTRLEDYEYLLDKVIIKGTRHHYDVQIPDYDGVNYISEHGPVSDKQMEMIYSTLDKQKSETLKKISKTRKRKFTGRDVYVALWHILGSDEKASKLLNKAGFVGIHYYGGRDGECYVIFNEKDAQIVRHELYGLQGVNNVQMQQRELNVVRQSHEIICKHHGGESKINTPLDYNALHDCYTELVNFYNQQQTIYPKDSVAVSLQQYSTPCPIAFLMGEYVKNVKRAIKTYFEPTAGNGMLTISLPHSRITVNELDTIRHKNLLTFNYYAIYNQDALDIRRLDQYTGVIMNPPFGNLPKGKEIKRSGTIGGKDITYKFGRIDYAIAVNALDTMYNDGKAAIIVGGKLSAKVGDYSQSYWKDGKIYGQYRDFISYLHRQYNIADIIYIDGVLYRKQGTTFPIVLILIDGRTQWNGDIEHVWHKYNPTKDRQISTFDELFVRMSKHLSSDKKSLVRREIELLKNYTFANNKLSGSNNFKIKDKDDGFSYFDESPTLVDRFYTYIKVRELDKTTPSLSNYFWDEEGHLCFASWRKKNIKDNVDFFDIAERLYQFLVKDFKNGTLSDLSESDRQYQASSIWSFFAHYYYSTNDKYNFEYLDTYLAEMSFNAIKIADEYYASPFIKKNPDYATYKPYVHFYKVKDIVEKRMNLPKNRKPGQKVNNYVIKKIQPENILTFDPDTPRFSYVYHNQGYNLYINPLFILKQKTLYPSESEGTREIPKRFQKQFKSIVSKKDYDLRDVERVINNTVNSNTNVVRFDAQDMYKYVCDLFDYYEKQIGDKLRQVGIPFYSNGKFIFSLPSEHIMKWIRASYTISANSIMYMDYAHPIRMECIENKGDLFICMPLLRSDIPDPAGRYALNNGKFVIDNDYPDILYRAYDFGESYTQYPSSIKKMVDVEIRLLK